MGDGVIITVFVVLIALAVFGAIKSNKTKARGKKVYGASESSVAIHMHGIPDVPQYRLANLFLSGEKLVIESEKKVYEIRYDQLTAAESMQKSELLKKDKSVIARGVVGGLLLGPIGAIIGGLSGMGQKKIKGDFLIINYRSAADSEVKVLIFDVKNILQANKLAKSLKAKIPVSAVPNGSITL